jgi:hypothetical protein
MQSLQSPRSIFLLGALTCAGIVACGASDNSGGESSTDALSRHHAVTCLTLTCKAGFHCEQAPAKSAACVHDAPSDPAPTCLTLTCKAGLHCESISGKAECVSDTSAPTCLTLTCKAGFHCSETSDGAACVDDFPKPTCLTLTCMTGFHCAEDSTGEAQCIAD